MRITRKSVFRQNSKNAFFSSTAYIPKPIERIRRSQILQNDIPGYSGSANQLPSLRSPPIQLVSVAQLDHISIGTGNKNQFTDVHFLSEIHPHPGTTSSRRIEKSQWVSVEYLFFHMVRIIKTTSFRPYNFTHNRAHRISLIKYQFGNITKSVFGRQIPPIAASSIDSNLQGISTFPLRYPIDSNRIAEVQPDWQPEFFLLQSVFP